MFTRLLTFGALLGGVMGYVWSLIWPGALLGLFAIIGAGALLAATTQGPISAAVLMIEMTGHDRAFIVPLLFAVAVATLFAAPSIAPSIHDARLTDEELSDRQR